MKTLEDIRKETESHPKFKELQKEGLTFEDFTVIRGEEYIQKARSGYALYTVIDFGHRLAYNFNECDL